MKIYHHVLFLISILQVLTLKSQPNETFILVEENDNYKEYFYYRQGEVLYHGETRIRILNDDEFEYVSYSGNGIATIAKGKLVDAENGEICFYSEKDSFLSLMDRKGLSRMDWVFHHPMNGKRFMILGKELRPLDNNCLPKIQQSHEVASLGPLIPDSLKMLITGKKSFPLADSIWEGEQNDKMVMLLCDGIVSEVFSYSTGSNIVRIAHGNVYSHILDLKEIHVEEGQFMKKGDFIDKRSEDTKYWLIWLDWEE